MRTDSRSSMTTLVLLVWAFSFSAAAVPNHAGFGVLCLILGSVWMLMERPVGLGFLLAGGLCLLWGGVNLLRARKAPVDTSA
jgi:protein-S-isoprenylcysteine O-methyltransferase Ste14